MPPRVVEGIAELRSLIGQEAGVSDWFAVTQSRIDAFAETTEDRNWLHLDAKRAEAELPHGKTIAHGFLTLSLLSCLLKQAVQVRSDFKQAINYGLDRVRFPAPVTADSRIRARCTLAAVDDVPGGVQIRWHVVVECEGAAKPVLVADWLGRLY